MINLFFSSWHLPLTLPLDLETCMHLAHLRWTVLALSCTSSVATSSLWGTHPYKWKFIPPLRPKISPKNHLEIWTWKQTQDVSWFKGGEPQLKMWWQPDGLNLLWMHHVGLSFKNDPAFNMALKSWFIGTNNSSLPDCCTASRETDRKIGWRHKDSHDATKRQRSGSSSQSLGISRFWFTRVFVRGTFSTKNGDFNHF